MKISILSFLLLPSCILFAQDKNRKQIDLTIVGSLINHATPAQVKEKFGEASEEVVTPGSNLLLYKTDSTQYLFTFDTNFTLQSFVFDNRKHTSPDQLAYGTVKEARTLVSRKALSQKLGSPTQVTIDEDKETWYYKFGDGQSGEKNLIIEFDLTQPQTVKSYNYYADLKKSIVLSSDIVRSVTKGLSTISDIEKKIGEPNKVILSTDTENWYYTSDRTTLIVYFDNQSKVNDFLFSKKSGDN